MKESRNLTASVGLNYLLFELSVLFVECPLLTEASMAELVSASDSQSIGPGFEFVNRQLVCLRPVRIRKNVMSYLNYLFQLLTCPH